MNNLKTVVLMVTLTLMLVFIGAILGGKSGMTIALVIAFGMNFFAYWFSDRIVLRMYGAREVNEAEAPELYGIVARLAQKAQSSHAKGLCDGSGTTECLCNRKKSGTWRRGCNDRAS